MPEARVTTLPLKSLLLQALFLARSDGFAANSAYARELVVSFVFRKPTAARKNAIELLAGTADFAFR